jgi:hypothetical protein
MSHLSPLPINLERSHSPASVAASDTTYHSFYDVELYEPASPVTTLRHPPRKDEHFEPKPITRQDSGYGSTHSASYDYKSNASHRNTPQARYRNRPSVQRAAKSMPASYPRRHTGTSLSVGKSQVQNSTSYYFFPSPDAITGSDEGVDEPAEVYHHPPPQTTHYWMSDHTRRLEYAAIDNASRGIKGWVMKHVVPDCFVPKSNRRLTFDDDSGSVRRYRLELDCDDCSMKAANRSRKLGWMLGR